jgi:hypothetical protein
MMVRGRAPAQSRRAAISSQVQIWSAIPAAMAGVRGYGFASDLWGRAIKGLLPEEFLAVATGVAKMSEALNVELGRTTNR